MALGAMFGPIVTKWFQLLNRLKFSSPTKAVMYRVNESIYLLWSDDMSYLAGYVFVRSILIKRPSLLASLTFSVNLGAALTPSTQSWLGSSSAR